MLSLKKLFSSFFAVQLFLGLTVFAEARHSSTYVDKVEIFKIKNGFNTRVTTTAGIPIINQ